MGEPDPVINNFTITLQKIKYWIIFSPNKAFQTNNSNVTLQVLESQLVGGEPAGYLQAWPKIWTWD